MLILIRLTFHGFRLPIFQIRIPITDDRSMSLAEDQESVHWSACALIVANANAITWIIIRSRDHWRCFHVVVHVFLFHGEIHFAIHFYWFFFPKAKLVYFIEGILSWIYCGLDFFRPEHVFEVFRMCHTVREILPPTFNFVSRLFPFYFLTVFFSLLVCFSVSCFDRMRLFINLVTNTLRNFLAGSSEITVIHVDFSPNHP